MEQRQYRRSGRYRRGTSHYSGITMGFVFAVFLCCLLLLLFAISVAAEFRHGM